MDTLQPTRAPQTQLGLCWPATRARSKPSLGCIEGCPLSAGSKYSKLRTASTRACRNFLLAAVQDTSTSEMSDVSRLIFYPSMKVEGLSHREWWKCQHRENWCARVSIWPWRTRRYSLEHESPGVTQHDPHDTEDDSGRMGSHGARLSSRHVSAKSKVSSLMFKDINAEPERP